MLKGAEGREYLNRYAALLKPRTNLMMLSNLREGQLTIELIAYIFIQLLKMTIDVTEQAQVFFYLDLMPENVCLSHSSPDESKWLTHNIDDEFEQQSS